MKTAVLGESEPGEVIYHPTLLALAAPLRLSPQGLPTLPGQDQGQGWSGPFRYVRQDFFLAGQFDDLNDLNRQFDCWRHELANQRTHAHHRPGGARRFRGGASGPATLAQPARSRTSWPSNAG